MYEYLALLRGINVGGKNSIKMTDLVASFESCGFSTVMTYIQSGNVLFNSLEKEHKQLEEIIETALSARFSYQARVVIRSRAELRQIVHAAPQGFGADPSTYRYDVLFLRDSIDAKAALTSISCKEGVDQAFAGEKVLYFSRLISKATQSHLTRIIALPIYQEMTIRNWNTTTKLLALMEK